MKIEVDTGESASSSEINSIAHVAGILEELFSLREIEKELRSKVEEFEQYARAMRIGFPKGANGEPNSAKIEVEKLISSLEEISRGGKVKR